MTFKDLLIKPELIDALQVQNITQPTQIQCKAAKPVFDGRDMIACSSTGSGKTLAYLLPVLSSVDLAENTLQALVLVPTQELASQVNKQIQLLFDNMHSDAHTLMLIGDGNITRQIESLKIKPVIAVATPSRAAQLIRMKKLKVHNVKTLILDEADKLMDKTYLESIIFIRKSLMKRTQVLLFSASISNKTIKQANTITYNPVIYELSKENKELIPKVIRERYTDLTDDEVEEVRQRVILDTIFKSGEVVDDKGEPITFEPGKQEKESEGNKLLKIANRFIEIDKLSINLIDTVNPFQRAYEVMSKSIDAPTLKIIQNTIAEQKSNLTIEEAITLFKGPLKQYIQEHNGKIPSADDPNPKVRELAAALQMMKNLKERKMRGLDFNPDEFKK